MVTVGSPAPADTSQLFIDDEQIGLAPPSYSRPIAPISMFSTAASPPTKDKDKAARVADVEKYLADHKVSYASGPASVISVCIHDTLDAEGYSFVGHTGVRVDISDGILFVEKLAFDAPYRAVTFASRSELKDYLRSMYDDGPTMDYGSPLIFENGAPLH